MQRQGESGQTPTGAVGSAKMSYVTAPQGFSRRKRGPVLPSRQETIGGREQASGFSAADAADAICPLRFSRKNHRFVAHIHPPPASLLRRADRDRLTR